MPADGNLGECTTPREADCDAEDCALLNTLQEGLRVLPCNGGSGAAGDSECAAIHSRGSRAGAADDSSSAATSSARPEERSRFSAFRGPDGGLLQLPVSEQDSISYRIEALKVHLEQEVGLADFLAMYRYLSDCASGTSSCGGATTTAEEQESLPLQLASPAAAEFLPLVHQLLTCEDACFGGL